jgi:hypothetical protein
MVAIGAGSFKILFIIAHFSSLSMVINWAVYFLGKYYIGIIMSTFISTVIASTADSAITQAEAETRAKVAAELGGNIKITNSFQSVTPLASGGFSATFTITADTVPAPPEVQIATDPRIISTTPLPTVTTDAPTAQPADEFAGIDAQIEANAAAAQPFPYSDDATGVDAQVAANSPTPVNTFLDPQQQAAAALAAAGISVGSINNVQDPQQAAAAAANSQAVVGTQLAQRQAVLEAQRKLVNNGDWRVRLSLAAGADYLYNASSPGILQPLAVTSGVIFPYMPKIDVAYKADYESYALTHSNYKGHFYKSSYTDAVNLTATFTAQDTTEANYLLAVIHFFRSVTKMFYGQDAQRGAPPPLVYLTGLGEYQFAAHPCVVSSFQYSLPNDVDYIRAGSTNINGTNLITRRARQDLPTNPITGALKRLENLFSSQGINKGAIANPFAPPTLGKNSPTYVPTKIDLTISLLPMQTRAQVSQQFSLKSFANGDLIKGGFW